MIQRLLGVGLFCAMLAGAIPALAGETEHWGEYALQARVNDRVSLRTDVQMRIRDEVSDFYWYRWEIGPNIKVDNRWLNVQTFFRFKRQEYGTGWENQYNIFIDPIVKLYNDKVNTFDFRVRIHTQLNGEGKRQFIRLRPRITTRFDIGKMRCSWFACDDFWFQVNELGARDRFNTNWAATGVRFGLNKPLSLAVYYQYRSDKLPATGKWDHDPVIGTSLQWTM
jgi:hypothetical protein